MGVQLIAAHGQDGIAGIRQNAGRQFVHTAAPCFEPPSIRWLLAATFRKSLPCGGSTLLQAKPIRIFPGFSLLRGFGCNCAPWENEPALSVLRSIVRAA
jgi:hypothetical protein